MAKLKGAFFLLVFLVIPVVSASVVINEVMYAPSDDQGGYTKGEWIELYNNESCPINLDDWTMKDEGSANTILEGTIDGNSYLIIADNMENFNLTYNCSCPVIEGNLGLRDEGGDIIYLWNSSGNLVNELNYANFTNLARKNNNSLQIVNGGWCEGPPTPGSANACSEEEPPPDEQEEPGNKSIIRIEDSPSDAEFGETIKVEIYIYKGDTSKYAIYAYVENEDDDRVSEKTTIHAKSKFTEYEMTIPIQLKSNCDGKYEDGEHTLIVEGLGEKDKEDMDIEGITSSLCSSQTTSISSTSSRKKLNYDITLPEKFEINKEFSTEVKITNGKLEDISLKIWSYLYRSSKCYSCESNREENAKEITIKSGESEEITLKNKVASAEPGNYRFKVKVQEPQLVNPREFTYDIKLEAAEVTEQQSIETTQTITGAATKTTKSIYIADSRTLRNMGIILLIITSILLTVIMWKKGLI